MKNSTIPKNIIKQLKPLIQQAQLYNSSTEFTNSIIYYVSRVIKENPSDKYIEILNSSAFKIYFNSSLVSFYNYSKDSI